MTAAREVKNIVYITDLDGTLLKNDASISIFAENMLNDLIQEGLLFSVASARSVVSIRKMLSGLKLKLPVIEFNGAFISDLETGEHHIINSIEPSVTEPIFQLINSFQYVPLISTFNGKEDCLYYNEISNKGIEWYVDNRVKNQDERLRYLNSLNDALKDEVVCLTVIGKYGMLSELKYAISDQFSNSVELHLMENQYSPGWYWLTVHDYKATKDRAIETLLEKYNIKDNYELVAFGDNDNDIKMLQSADRAIVVANASDSVKQYATQIIGPNSDDSVAKFIHKEWNRS